MHVYKDQVVEVKILEDVICDVCGKSCRDSDNLNFEYATLHADWGHCSNKDGIGWTGHICYRCADKIQGFIRSLGGNIILTFD